MKLVKYYIFCISIIKIPQKSLKQFHQLITIMGENMIVIRDFKTFCFNFDWLKDGVKNLNHEFIIKNNEFSAENKIKNKIEHLLLQYMHGINILKRINTKNSKTSDLHKFF